MITLIDYGAGNIESVMKAFKFLGFQYELTSDKEKIRNAEKLVLPGVGSFGEAMLKLNESGLSDIITDVVKKGTPILGICLGLQLLFEGSEESEGVKGLSLLKGVIRRFPETEGYKIPHVGWNSLKPSKDSRLFKGISGEPYVYFVHSYYLEKNESIAAATCNYILDFNAAIEKDNIFACQFHPEKSGDTGLKILENFARL